MKCLILAGGFATRLYPLTEKRAKALLEFKGRPVISHILDRVPRPIEVLVTTSRKFKADFLKWQKTVDRPVRILVEDAATDAQKMGAVSAVDFWIRTLAITEDILVIAGDNYFEVELADMLAGFDSRRPLIAVHDVGDKDKACEIGRACQVGLVILEADRVVRLDEKPEVATSSIIATGVYVLPATVFPLLSEYCREKRRDNMGSFISFLLEKAEVHAYSFTETWLDIGDQIYKGNLLV
jgi:glucose-1-phosphate thymidylyltransferase